MAKHPLVGKLVSACLPDLGFHTFKVRRVVERGRGRKRQLTAVVGHGPRYLGSDRWNWSGRRYKAELRDFERPAAGVIHRKQCLPIAEYLARRGGAS